MRTVTAKQEIQQSVSHGSPNVKALFEQLSSLVKSTPVNQFIMLPLTWQGEEIAHQEQVIHLSLRDTHLFLHTLERSAKPNTTLLRAAKHYQKNVMVLD